MLKLERLHPVSQLLFFILTIIVPITFNNPFFSVVSLFCAFLYILVSYTKKALKTLLFAFLAVLFVGLCNMVFAHWGNTALFTVKNVDFTLESLCYGLNQGCVLASVMIWFGVFGKCVDSERIIYLFRYTPKLALIFSMVLGFIPRFIKKSEDIRDARLALNGGARPETLKEKIVFAKENMSALVSYSLESSIITSQSMEARGYNPKAIRPSGFKLSSFDIVFIFFGFTVAAFILFQYALGNIIFVFDPDMYIKTLSLPALVLFLIFELYPFISELKENIKWKLSSVKA